MITLVVPTRNRSHALKLVAPSYYRQDLVDELIFIDDNGEDDTVSFLSALAEEYPDKKTIILRNECRQGAAYSRIRGYQQAKNEYILYCDDDEYLQPGYAAICLRKMKETGAGIVSGRRIHKLLHETPEQAVQRFGSGLVDAEPFNKAVCEFLVEARYSGDIKIPLTNSIILTQKALLEKYGYDPFYSSGNGYREESDYQMNLFVNGYDILVTNETHSIHLSRQECQTGGQRVDRFRRWYWSIYYTRYFYRKYYDRYAQRVGLRIPRQMALVVFSVYRGYFLFIKPFGKLLSSAKA